MLSKINFTIATKRYLFNLRCNLLKQQKSRFQTADFMLQLAIITETPLDELVDKLLKRGGHVNNYYLKDFNKNKPAVVFLKRWFSGKNIKQALMKALS